MAKRFRFRLEAVLELRRQERDAQRRRVAEAAAVVTEAQTRIARLQAEYESSRKASRETQAIGSVDLTWLSRQELHRNWLRRSMDIRSAELISRRADLESRQAELATASGRLKVVEKLRERRWTQHRRDVNREEQLANDEAGVLLYLRRRQVAACEE